MTTREIVAGLRQAEHVLRIMFAYQAAAACLAAIEFIEAKP